MNKRNVIILYGGKSGEHEVSLRSASSVEAHLNKNIYNVILIGITKSGLWYYQNSVKRNKDSLIIEERGENLISLIPGRGLYLAGELLKADFIYPILHGTFGEDGTLQGLLEMIDIPYAGSGLDGSFMAMDKEYAKVIWQRDGLPVVPFISVKKHDSEESKKSKIEEAVNKFNYPLFIKPVQAGSSVGVSMVTCEAELAKAIDLAFNYDEKLLIEPGVDAREIECSVIGNEEPITFTLGEIAPSHEFYDYDAKYLDPNGAELIIPAKLDMDISDKIREIARKAYLALNIKGFSRVDFFMDRKSGEVMLNEVNTIPGFTNVSMFSMLCAEDGLDYTSLLDRLYEYGIERYNQRKELVFNLRDK